MDDDDMREAPPAVIGAVAAGVAPTPFLAVYAVLFIAHGFFHPVQPPDITTTNTGEKIAGVVALALLLVMVLTIFWFLNGRRRWPFVIGQLATLGDVDRLRVRPDHRLTGRPRRARCLTSLARAARAGAPCRATRPASRPRRCRRRQAPASARAQPGNDAPADATDERPPDQRSPDRPLRVAYSVHR